MATTLIKNGTVISTTGVIAQDVLITDETVTALGSPGYFAGAEGDATVSSTPPASTSSPAASTCTPTWSCPSAARYASDTFETGTRAAAWGGVTTIVDFAVQHTGENVHDGAGRLAPQGRRRVRHRLRASTRSSAGSTTSR